MALAAAFAWQGMLIIRFFFISHRTVPNRTKFGKTGLYEQYLFGIRFLR